MSELETVIRVDNVSKRYTIAEYQPKLRQQAGKIIRSWLGSTRREGKTGQFWALRDINFTVQRGENIALIGHNGAGKTTMLRLLSGITNPTIGKIEVNGRFTTLVALGTGFDMERTGRENIHLTGAIYGYSKSEIEAIIDDIIVFSELGDFINVAVKRYSSGMIARLGFSIAIHVMADIIFLDEVLAVGDAAFQEKCNHRIMQLTEENRTIVLVTHSPDAVRMLCNRAIWLQNGQLQEDGETEYVLERYMQS